MVAGTEGAFDLFEGEEVVLFEEVLLFFEEGEAAFLDLGADGFLAGADVTEDEIGAHPLDAFEVDDDEAAAGCEGAVDGLEGCKGKFEVVVSGADEGEVDGARGEVDVILGADDALDLFPAAHVRTHDGVVDEGLGDVDGVDSSAPADSGREEAGEKAGAGADVGHAGAGGNRAGGDDGVAAVVDFAALFFKALDPPRGLGVGEELFIDAGFDTLFLGGEQWRGGRGEENEKGEEVFHGIAEF